MRSTRCRGRDWRLEHERFASRREIADLRRVPSLLLGPIRRVFSLVAPRAARNRAISPGPANRSVLWSWPWPRRARATRAGVAAWAVRPEAPRRVADGDHSGHHHVY